jgi:hypothetical protein
MGQERKVYKVLWESLKERDHSKDQGIDGEDGIGMYLGKTGWGVLSGFNWLRIGAGGGLL